MFMFLMHVFIGGSLWFAQMLVFSIIYLSIFYFILVFSTLLLLPIFYTFL